MNDGRRLGSTDYEISPIGLGCLQFAQGRGVAGRIFSPLDATTTREIVGAALAGGVNWFDTAEVYGRGASEQALTTALRDNRVTTDEVLIATKWAPWLRRSASIERTISDRFRALQGYPIGLHQIHGPHGSLSSMRVQLRAMARLARENRIGAVGVSDFSAQQLREAAEILRQEGVTLASNQTRISLLDRDIEHNGVLQTARDLGITLIAYSPLCRGVLTGRLHEDPAHVQAQSRSRRRRNPHLRGEGLARTRPLIEEMRAIAHAYDVSVTQVALNWLITFYGDTVVAIPGASRPRQAEEAAAAMELKLTGKELERLAVAGERVR
ncbi:aldo/keto reductase [Streptomyces phyllanthi]|uniref:Aldo/keto reductase n=1 Tax=Streptomyces phyllanthi TaxID=1803180 RepID=A0A5N8VT64_9ACTN|nr:aldo/keto reductase [Streptomyces phyllanthi]MPY38431.1 aldo/keto reductase [Streptomyces phyllanthi]